MKEEIYNTQFIHYESLLIKKLDEIAINYKKRKLIKILSPIGGIIITILGWSNDNIGAKILENVMNILKINWDATMISYIIYIIINVSLPATSIYALVRAKQIKKGITIDFLKEPMEQYKLLVRYILEKYKKTDSL